MRLVARSNISPVRCIDVPFPGDAYVIGFARADAQGAFQVQHEDLAVADLVGVGGLRDRVDNFLDDRVRHGDLDADFRQEAHFVFRAAVDFRLALLAAVAADFRHGHARRAGGGAHDRCAQRVRRRAARTGGVAVMDFHEWTSENVSWDHVKQGWALDGRERQENP